MNKRNLTELLRSFTSEEIKEFGEFVRSPYFNKNENVVKLFNYLRKFHPLFESAALTKEMIHSALFPGEKYNDGYMRKLVFNLNKLAEEFLRDIHVKSDKLAMQVHLLYELEKRGQIKQVEKKLRETESFLDELQNSSPDVYHNMYELEFIKNILFVRNLPIKKRHSNVSVLQKRPEYAVYSFISKMFSHYYFILNVSHMVDYSPELIFFDEIKLFLEKNKKYLDDPLISIKYLSVNLLKELNVENYTKLKEAFVTNLRNLRHGDKYNVGMILLNYNQIRNMNEGGDAYSEEIFYLYELLIKNNIYSYRPDIYLDGKAFLNIVFASITHNKPDWLKQFMKRYSGKLNPETKDDLVNYANAKIHFSKNEFENALNSLARINYFKDADLALAYRILRLMVYYELGMEEQAISSIDSYKHFLKNEKALPPKVKNFYGNFIKFYYLVLTAKLKNKKSSQLLNKFQKAEHMAEWGWLKEKIEELGWS